MEHDIETIAYEQCLCDWSHVSQIYGKIKTEPLPPLLVKRTSCLWSATATATTSEQP
jgi:hypothetical protein